MVSMTFTSIANGFKNIGKSSGIKSKVSSNPSILSGELPFHNLRFMIAAVGVSCVA